MREFGNRPHVNEAAEYLKTQPSDWTSLKTPESQKLWFDAHLLLHDHYACITHSVYAFEKERKLKSALELYFFKQFTTSSDGSRIDPNNVVIYFGSAKFPASGKGEPGAVPTISIRKLLQRMFTTILVDEHLTCQMCSICENLTESIKRNNKTNRDFRKCSQCNCIIDRDYNACLNIAKAAIGWHVQDGKAIRGRPEYLQWKSPSFESS